MASRAIHLECLDDMDLQIALINALRCFIALRGSCSLQMRCGQWVKTLSEAKRILDEALNEIKWWKGFEDISKTINASFIMNAPHSSHMGGRHGRGHIRTVRKSTGKSFLEGSIDHAWDTSTLRTFSIRGYGNRELPSLWLPKNLSNPMGPETSHSESPIDDEKTKTTAAATRWLFPRKRTYARQRWRKVQHLAQEFWKQMEERVISWLYKKTVPSGQKPQNKTWQPVTLFLLKDENLYRGDWRTGTDRRGPLLTMMDSWEKARILVWESLSHSRGEKAGWEKPTNSGATHSQN